MGRRSSAAGGHDPEKIAAASPNNSINDGKLLDEDAAKLAEMGYSQDMKRNFTVWSVLAVGFSLTNSWFGISLAMVTGINSGGPALLVYGIPLIGLISTCVGISLAEMASALPNAGGQYFWANELAPRRYANFASYLTGWFAWSGSIFTSASVALGMGSAVVGCWQLTHPDFVIEAWHVVLTYELINLMAFFFNCYGRFLPILATCTFCVSLTSFVVILITVPATAPTHESAKFVFATFINSTGWPQPGIAFIVGLINCNWAFACLDCATHLAEEVPRPEKMIPIAILGTVAIGFVTAWSFSVSMMFSLSDLDGLTGTSTLVPILQLFYQAIGSNAGAIVLEVLIVATGTGCLIASHTWQSRLCWSFARDRGIPGHQWLSKVHPTLGVPLIAHATSCFLVSCVGLLYLGSYAAFNSMVTACIVLLYVSYAIPIIALQIRGRNNIRHGPFWLGPVGRLANYVLLGWTCFAIIMYSFPYYYPVTADNMNYVPAVYAVVLTIISLDWFIRARKHYRGHEGRKDEYEVEATVKASISQ